MGNICGRSQPMSNQSMILCKKEHENCDYRSTKIREVHEEFSHDNFISNMERFNEKWPNPVAKQGHGFVDASCFKDLFYIIKKHAHLSILPELLDLIKQRRRLLHKN